jgi:hypothetical protein
MKYQINIINVAGAAVSASLLISSFFLPSISAFPFAKRTTIPQIQKISIPQKQINLENNKKIDPTTSSTKISTHINLKKLFHKKTAPIEKQKQEPTQPKDKCEEPTKSNATPINLKIVQKEIAPIEKQKQEPTQPKDKCEEPTKSNGCPKNLDYFTLRPRPKQMPEECFTCENMITCACLTGKQSK